jgi:hypothetical protein
VTTDYVLDLNAGLTQVLDDGTNIYLYGNGRIGELQPGGFAYHLGDALGDVTLAKSYEPFGSLLKNSDNCRASNCFINADYKPAAPEILCSFAIGYFVKAILL